MKFNRRTVAVAAAAGALAAGGVGAAIAIGGNGDSDQPLTGPDAERAEAAALDAVGGGKVLESERQEAGDGKGAYEVEIERPDGSQVEVYVTDSFDVAGQGADDDDGSESEDDDAGADD